MSTLNNIQEISFSLKEKLQELSSGHEIQFGVPENNTPGLPYKGSIIPLQKNLHPNARYLVGVGTTGPGLGNIAACINNLIEMISYLIIHQNTENFNELDAGQKAVKIELEKQFQKIIEILEQNRQNIKSDTDQIRELAEEKHETLFQNQQRIINRLDEQTSDDIEKKIQQLSEKIDLKFEETDKQLAALREYIKKILE